MNAKPSDFFLGAIEFFAILLPGVVLVILVPQSSRAEFINTVSPEFREPLGAIATGAALLAAGYIAGHALRGLGELLELLFYNSHYDVPRHWLGGWRKLGEQNSGQQNSGAQNSGQESDSRSAATNEDACKRMERADKERQNRRWLGWLWWLRDHLLGWLSDRWDSYSVLRAAACRRMKEEEEQQRHDTGLIDGGSSVLHWAGTAIRLRAPQAIDEIVRRSADFKLFRSLIFVTAFGAISFGVREFWSLPTLTVVALLLLSVWQYLRLRWQTDRLIYEYYLQLPAIESKNAERSGEMEQPS